MECEPILALFQEFEPFFGSLDPNPDPHQINIRIRIRIMVIYQIRIRINVKWIHDTASRDFVCDRGSLSEFRICARSTVSCFIATKLG